jgi:hypothetical protein
VSATDPRQDDAGKVSPAGPEHQHYFNDLLGGLYCRDCGEPVPCLHNRQLWEAEQALGVRCLCSHTDIQHKDGIGFCNLAACGCKRLRPAVAA